MIVVASGELMVVHQKMHIFSKKACDTEASKKVCTANSSHCLEDLIIKLIGMHLVYMNGIRGH